MSDQQPFRAEPILSGLTGFQRNTVEHIVERFYRQRDASRFLVADETGLGKTIIARGVIARAIEELEHDDSVERIDIVYVCSNADLAAQNLGKLNVTGEDHHAFSSRLTLLAKHSRHLRLAATRGLSKPVNLVSFTPGTSFEKGWRTGKAEERAMLYLLLSDHLGLSRNGSRARAAKLILQGGLSSVDRFAEVVAELRRELSDDLDETVRSAFLRAAGPPDDPATPLGRFTELIEELHGKHGLNQDRRARSAALVGELRSILARESVQLIEPDLVILDEFQRFRQLIDKGTEAGELAHHLYEFGASTNANGRPTAKTLLLSATPYKPFTYAEEDEDHHRDFMKVVAWLADGADGDPSDAIARDLNSYRRAVIAGQSVAEVTGSLRASLLRVMSRTERPRTLAVTMGEEHIERVDDVSPDALLGFVALCRLAEAVGAPVSVEYWKSSPYFVNFMDGYKIGEKVRAALKDPASADHTRSLLRQTRHLDLGELAEQRPLDADAGNGRLRRLKRQTVDAGWWRLLWLPPTLPYLMPGGPYRDPMPMTKRLVFSSWTATPTAIASLLSYEADRLAVGTAWQGRSTEERDTDRKTRRGRLAYRMDSASPDRPAAMAHLALFWPMPGLAKMADPLALRRESDGLVDPAALIERVRDKLRDAGQPSGEREASHWFEAFARLDSLPGDLASEGELQRIVAALAGHDEPDEDAEQSAEPANLLLAKHVTQALWCRGRRNDRAVTDAVLATLAEVAAHSPANIAYRSLQRIRARHPAITEVGLWTAAAQLASSLRSLFARPETTLLLDQLAGEQVYWRAILQYCAWGNLQAVMDEYVHHLFVAQGSPELDDTLLLGIARTAGEAIALRPARYELFDPGAPESRPTLSAHFALRYGGRRQEQDSARQPQVRQAFNSPFRPFVLASTSVGQEGIDFHWWCHSIVHWNTPASPIDFEQREGRIDRYDGHAVRLNIAEQHREAILRSPEADPWDAAYRIASESAGALGAFAPHWVYGGPAKIQRHIVPFALSVDELRLTRIKRDVALYHLTFGQPRQEDMLELLNQQYSSADPARLESMRLDLSAPAWSGGARSAGAEGAGEAGPAARADGHWLG